LLGWKGLGGLPLKLAKQRTLLRGFTMLVTRNPRCPHPPEAARPNGPAPEVNNPFQQIFGPPHGDRGRAQYIRSEPVQWLEKPPEPWHVQGREWWKIYGTRYPRGLAKMARDYLAIPATSVPSERLFSRAGMSKFPSFFLMHLTFV
jgi:hypothetical protein